MQTKRDYHFKESKMKYIEVSPQDGDASDRIFIRKKSIIMVHLYSDVVSLYIDDDSDPIDKWMIVTDTYESIKTKLGE